MVEPQIDGPEANRDQQRRHRQDGGQDCKTLVHELVRLPAIAVTCTLRLACWQCLKLLHSSDAHSEPYKGA